MDDFELTTLNGYSISIYNTLMELCHLELNKQKDKEYDQVLSRLKFSFNCEQQIYKRIYDENNYQKYIKDEYTITNILENIIMNNQKFLDNARISNNFKYLMNDNNSLIRNVLIDDTLKTMLNFIQNNDDDIEYGIKAKYLLAYMYPNICSYLIDNNFEIAKDVYWYSYFIKDVLRLSDAEFYRERVVFGHAEFVNEYFSDITVINHDKTYFGKIISRIISLLLPEDYDMNVNKFVKTSQEMGLNITENSAQKVLKTFNEDRNIPKILRLYK